MDTPSGPRPMPGRPRQLPGTAASATAAVTDVLTRVVPAAADPSPGPAPVTVLTRGADNANGDIFIAPFGDASNYANGPEISNTASQVIWFHPVPAGVTAPGFRTRRTPLPRYSRAITVQLNPWNKTATLVQSDDQPEGLSAASAGNAQTTRNGGLLVGWGTLPYFSEFGPPWQLEFNAEFQARVNICRAYRLPWFRMAGARIAAKGGAGG